MLPLLALLPHPPSHLPLGQFPSPLEWRSDLAEVLGCDSLSIKRDDLNAAAFGGNKVRALEWLLPGAGPNLLTIGGYGSTHAAAVSVYARLTGRQAWVALFPQPWSDRVSAMLGCTAANASVHLASSRIRFGGALVAAYQAARRHGRVSWIAAGAATPLGVLGSVNAALEWTEQVKGGGGPKPDAIVLPLGSGGTAAGLLVGLRLAGWRGMICAVPVTDRVVANSIMVRWLALRTVQLLRRCGLRMPSSHVGLAIYPGFLGAGYGHPTEAGIAASRLALRAGLPIDPTYGAKAFAALAMLAGSYRHPCFWHTFDTRVPEPSNPGPLLEQARRYAEALWPQATST